MSARALHHDPQRRLGRPRRDANFIIGAMEGKKIPGSIAVPGITLMSPPA
jgi:hypothetical protein